MHSSNKEYLQDSLRKSLLLELNESNQKHTQMLNVISQKQTKTLKYQSFIKKLKSENEQLTERLKKFQNNQTPNQLLQSSFINLDEVDMPKEAQLQSQEQSVQVCVEDKTKFDLITELRRQLVKYKVENDSLIASNNRFRKYIDKHIEKTNLGPQRLVKSEQLSLLRSQDRLSYETDQQYLDRVCDDETKRLKQMKLVLQADVDKLNQEIKLIRKNSQASDQKHEQVKMELKKEVERMKLQIVDLRVQLEVRENRIKELEQRFEQKQNTIDVLAKKLQKQEKALEESNKPKHISDYLRVLFEQAEGRIRKNPGSYDYDKLAHKLLDLINSLMYEFKNK